MKKTIAMLLAAVMLCGCLAGCGGTKDDTVMTVNGTEISYDEYMTWLGSAVSDIKSIYSTYSGTDVDWDGNFLFDASITNAEWCIKHANENLTKLHSVESKAKELGVTVTDEQKEDLEDEIEELRSTYATGDDTEASFKDFLAGYNYTQDSYRTQRNLNYLYYNVFAELYGEQGEKLDEAKVLDYAEKNDYVTSAHILIKTTKDVTDDDGKTTTEELSEAEKAEKLAQAQELADELKAITDNEKRWERFKELMDEYSEDPGKESFPNGYCFTTNTMVEIYDTTSRELAEYEVSDPVESTHGYHVIMRLPMTSSDLVSYTNGYQQSIVPLSYLAAPGYYDTDVSGWAKEATVKYTSLYEKVDFSQYITDDGFNFVSYADYSNKGDSD